MAIRYLIETKASLHNIIIVNKRLFKTKDLLDVKIPNLGSLILS